jgi:hypothetical protein
VNEWPVSTAEQGVTKIGYVGDRGLADIAKRYALSCRRFGR